MIAGIILTGILILFVLGVIIRLFWDYIVMSIIEKDDRRIAEKYKQIENEKDE